MKCAVLLLIACVPLVAIADERILDYHSDIVVQKNGWIEVTEIIRVRAEGRQIRRGIYRDYLTSYKDKLGNSVEVDYEPLAVLRNDQREDFHSEKYANGVRTYFGSADRRLNRGEHTYTYRYRAGRMLGFFDSHDELYWNVTGNGWAFPIDHASATVAFDFDLGSGEIAVNGYTGPQGYDGSDYQAKSRRGASAHFETTRPLPAGSGLTIVVTWPKGFVSEPTAIDKVGWLLSDNRNFLVALFGFFALFAYYVPVWKKHGKDPESGVVFARYEPPRGFSPASLRYIDKMHYDDTVMTSAVVNLAVKGYLKITNAGKTHSLETTIPGDNAPRLAAGERELYDGLFRLGQHIVLEDENHEVLGKAKHAHQASLKSDYASRYFATNGMLSLPGIVIALVASIIALNTGAGATFFVVAPRQADPAGPREGL